MGDVANDWTKRQMNDLDAGIFHFGLPLLKANGDEAAVRAQALRTPIVTLTQGGDPTAAGPFAFRGFMTLKHQIEALLDHAFEHEGHRRLAVLHPENGYGESESKRKWDHS